MRDTRGLVDSLIGYIQNSLQEGKAEDKVSFEILSALHKFLHFWSQVFKRKKSFAKTNKKNNLKRRTI